MGLLRPLILVAFAVAAAPALAQRTEIYKCIDEAGRASYTNDKRETAGKKCEVVTTQINVAPPPNAKQPPPQRQTSVPPPGAFPKESDSDRLKASARQREILERELAAEQAGLSKAREELAAQEAVRYGNERNYARVLERLRPYRDRVETHEKNIEALKRELATLNR